MGSGIMYFCRLSSTFYFYSEDEGKNFPGNEVAAYKSTVYQNLENRILKESEFYASFVNDLFQTLLT
jgi:hypothetical protein